MTTPTTVATTTEIELSALEFGIWREDEETDAEFARRTLKELQEYADEIKLHIDRLVDFLLKCE